MWFYIQKSPPHPPAGLMFVFFYFHGHAQVHTTVEQKLFPMKLKTSKKSYTSQVSFFELFSFSKFFQSIKANFYVYLRTWNNIKQNKIHVATDKIATSLPPLCFWTDVTRWLEVRYKAKGRPNGTISKGIIIGVKQLGKDPKPPQHRHLIWVLLRQLS